MPVYSHSRLGVYETCPRQYRFQYVDRVPVPEVRTVEMFLGSQVHAALEDLYTQVRRRTLPELSAILESYGQRWAEEWTDDILITRAGASADDYRRAGEEHLTAYHRRYHPFDRDRTVSVERLVMFPLSEERRIWLQGFVDRISVTREGLWQIHDYKTGRWVPTQAELDGDRQLALYQIGVQRAFPYEARRVELVWHYLAHDLELRSRREPEALQRLAEKTLAAIETIQSDTAFATITGPHCDRCSFRSICPAWTMGEVQLSFDWRAGPGETIPGPR
jgi:RecB family exonuclease